MPTTETITEELVRSLAPNPAAFSNAQKIARGSDFSGLSVTADKTLIFGECKGSGKNPYRTSADFSGESPVCRCTCPSRQFPCKHGLAIMLAYLSGKPFSEAEAPDDVAAKREKLAKKAERQLRESRKPRRSRIKLPQRKSLESRRRVLTSPKSS